MRLSALMTRKVLGVLASSLLLTGCFGDSDIRPIPIFPTGGGGGGSAPARPANPPAGASPKPMAPSLIETEEEGPDSPVTTYEQHGATSISQCQQMAERFKKEGRNVRLVKAVPNSFNSDNSGFRYICLFDGPDKVIEGNVFEDYRYNSPDEYNSP